jgi:hypothetical protein
VSTVEHPVHGVAAEDSRDLLLGGKQNQRRLQQARANNWGCLGFGDSDGTRGVRLEVVRFGLNIVGLLPARSVPSG